MKPGDTFRTVRRLNWQQRLILIEAGALLVAARLATWIVPFKRLAARLGEAMVESPTEITEEQAEAAFRIGWAIRGLGRSLPRTSQCLVQAVAATWMLQRRHIPSTLYFGLAEDPDGAVKAHAWVRSGTRIVTGAEGHQDFRVVATFA